EKEKPEPPIDGNKKNGDSASKKDQADTDKKGGAGGNKEGKPDGKEQGPIPKDEGKKPAESGPGRLPFEKPSTRQVHVADYVPPSTKEISILLQGQADRTDWRRISVRKPEVYSARPLLSLPGCLSDVQTTKG